MIILDSCSSDAVSIAVYRLQAPHRVCGEAQLTVNTTWLAFVGTCLLYMRMQYPVP